MSTVSKQSSRGLRHHSSPTSLYLHKFDVSGAQFLPCAGLTVSPRQNSNNLLSEAFAHRAEAHRECHTARKYRGKNVKYSEQFLQQALA